MFSLTYTSACPKQQRRKKSDDCEIVFLLDEQLLEFGRLLLLLLYKAQKGDEAERCILKGVVVVYHENMIPVAIPALVSRSRVSHMLKLLSLLSGMCTFNVFLLSTCPGIEL